jgi:hypothetical protein
VRIVLKDPPFERKVGRTEPCLLGKANSVAVSPTAVDADCQFVRQQTSESAGDIVVDDVAAIGRGLELDRLKPKSHSQLAARCPQQIAAAQAERKKSGWWRPAQAPILAAPQNGESRAWPVPLD